MTAKNDNVCSLSEGRAARFTGLLRATCREHWFMLAVLGVTLLLYGQVLTFSYTGWDDQQFIVGKAALYHLSAENLERIFNPGKIKDEQLYIPIFYLSYMIQHTLVSLSASVSHGINLLLHLLNIILVYVFIRRLRVNKNIAAIIALVFAIHPMQVEAVAWCMGRKDLLSCGFALAALLLFVDYQQKGRQYLYMLSFVCYLLACLSKPSAIIVPLLLILVLLREQPVDAHGKPLAVIRAWWQKRLFLKLTPFLILSLVIFYINSNLKQNSFGQTPELMLYRSFFVPAVFATWLEGISALTPPRIMYTWQTFSNPANISFVPWFALLLFLLAIIYGFYTKCRHLWFWGIFFLIGLLPILGQVCFFYRDIITASRYGYFAIIGIIALIVVSAFKPKAKAIKAGTITVLSLWILLALSTTVQTIPVWKNTFSLWSYETTINPTNSTAFYNLGNCYFRSKQLKEAIHCYQSSISLFPNLPGLYNLGICYEQQGDWLNALACFRRVLALDPNNPFFSLKVAKLYYRREMIIDAKRQLQALRRQFPNFPERYYRDLEERLMRHKRTPASKAHTNTDVNEE